ncbi:WXG100-like domain-containing protein [Nonomuraea africana]|uniref:WXG100-like domain-containing protein n=1 Tax=Nonomuraea africana TaxID=46171 RepID=UPI0033FABF11
MSQPEAETRDPSLLPWKWNWNPTEWGWNVNTDLGSAFNPQPLIDTIVALARALPTLFGGDGTEERLRAAANAHRRLGEELKTLEQAIDGPMDSILKSWKGPAADRFRELWGGVVDRNNRHALRANCTGCATVLDAVAESARLTKQALREIIEAALIWAGLFYALRMAAFLGARLVATAAFARAAQLVTMGIQLLARVGTLFRSMAGILRSLPLIGRLKMPGRLTALAGRAGASVRTGLARPFDAEFLAGLSKASFAKYAKTSGWVWAGVLGTQMTAQVLRGNSFFNLSPSSIVQSMRISTGATLAGTFAPIGGVFWKGGLQGGVAATWGASTVKTGMAVAEGGFAFAQFVAVRNWAISKVKWETQHKWLKGDGQKQMLGFAPTSVFRVWRPLHTNEVPELPPYQAPQAQRVGIWPYQGGSLQEMAAKVYGDASRWQEIYDFNRDLIGPDPRKIRPGTLLTYPLPD